MSFPNIPDINPQINLTCEDAINLLLTSIALEEISLSKLIDAEKSKVLFVIDECKHKKSTIKDVLDVNKSVDQTIKDIIKLQMLLQFKLENVGDLLPCSTSTTSTSTSTTTTTTTTTTTHTTTHTTTSTTSTCSTTTSRECCCSLIGKIKGNITNRCDEFYCQTAVIQLFVLNWDCYNRSLRYTVQNCNNTFCMKASEHNIKIDCPSHCSGITVIYGKGNVTNSNCSYANGSVNFVLKIWRKYNGIFEFKMVIKSDSNPELNHDSGIVPFRNLESDLQIEPCF